LPHSPSLSRRYFLAAGLALTGGAGGLFLADRVGNHQRSRVLEHRAGAPAGEAPSPEVLDTLTSYLETFFGRELSTQDRNELAGRLTFAATRDSGWGEEYLAAAALLDKEAAAHGFAAYTAADRETKIAVINALRQPLRGPLAGVRLSMSDSALARERMRVSTSRHLIHVYQHSGVPWRQQGFATWPGVPDQVAAYDRLSG
jgi:hypothetical protein